MPAADVDGFESRLEQNAGCEIAPLSHLAVVSDLTVTRKIAEAGT